MQIFNKLSFVFDKVVASTPVTYYICAIWLMEV